MKTLLVTNFASHYRAPFFERLAAATDVEFIFTSRGRESYWQPHLGTTAVDALAETLYGRPFAAGLNWNPRLAAALAQRDYDVLVKCINGRAELATAYTIAKLRAKPFVFWTSIWWQPQTPFGWLSQPFLSDVYRGADAIVTDGPHITRFIAGHGIAPDKLFTATIAAENDRFLAPVSPDERARLRDSLGARSRPLIVAVSRLVPQKGLDLLIDASASLSDLKPVVAVFGTGPMKRELDARARAAGVDLRLAGGMPPKSMPTVYAAADVYAMPSITTPRIREVWGLGVNEALCQSVPVVVSDAVGAAAGGLVTHLDTGLVVPERDSHALAAALRRILTDPGEASRLASNGHARVKSITYDAMVTAFLVAIDYSLKTRRHRSFRGRPQGRVS